MMTANKARSCSGLNVANSSFVSSFPPDPENLLTWIKSLLIACHDQMLTIFTIWSFGFSQGIYLTAGQE